jgi:hypothetical protein
VTVGTGGNVDKNWTVCDNSSGSPFYGNCYTEWDNNGQGNLIKMSTSTNGGLTWGPALNTADNATGIAGQPVVRKNGVVMATIKRSRVSAVVRIPIDPTNSGVDHFIPGLAVDRSTGGTTAHLGLTYYYFPVSNCGSSCQLHVGFVSSTDSGTTWSAPTDLAGPMTTTWLASTSQGRMVGDYISGSFAGGKTHPVFAVANAPVSGVFDEAMYSPVSGLLAAGVSAITADPVVSTTSDHPRPAQPVTVR